MKLNLDTTKIEKAVDLMNKYIDLLKEARTLASEIASLTSNLDLNFSTAPDSLEDLL